MRQLIPWVNTAAELQASTAWSRKAATAEEQVKAFLINPAMVDGQDSRLFTAIPHLEKLTGREISAGIIAAKAKYQSLEKQVTSGVRVEISGKEDDGRDNDLDELFANLFNNTKDVTKFMDLDHSDDEDDEDDKNAVASDNHASTPFASTEGANDQCGDSPAGDTLYGADNILQESLLVQQRDEVLALEYLLDCKQTWEAVKMTVDACELEVERLKQVGDVDDEYDADIAVIDPMALVDEVVGATIKRTRK